MKPAWESWTAFLLVASLHAGAIGFAIWSPSAKPKPVELPVIQGIFIPAPPAEVAQMPTAKAPPQPPVEKPPEPKPKPPKPKPKPPAPKPKPKPLPPPPVEVPPSETAITQEAAEEEVVPDEAPPPAPVATTISGEDRQGASVVPPRNDAAHLNNPQPAYPNASRRLREEGTVWLEVLITADGKVAEVKLKKSSGFKRLDDTALNAVRYWRYVPASRGGKPIDYWYEQPIEFNLH